MRPSYSVDVIQNVMNKIPPNVVSAIVRENWDVFRIYETILSEQIKSGAITVLRSKDFVPVDKVQPRKRLLI